MALTARQVLSGLAKKYDAHVTALSYGSEWELLVAVALSAQCTDARVNQVTPKLFKALPSIEDFARVRLPVLEKLIFSTGFYKSKARNLKAAASTILRDYHGIIPDSMEHLIRVPGVGRKTANVFLAVVHKKAEGITVDTHIFRVSRRTGAASGNTPEQVERALMAALPRKEWIRYADLAIQHGRVLCHARKPSCSACPLRKQCPSSTA